MLLNVAVWQPMRVDAEGEQPLCCVGAQREQVFGAALVYEHRFASELAAGIAVAGLLVRVFRNGVA